MDTKDCLQRLREVAKLRPGYPDVWNDLGLALADVGEYVEALGAFDRAIEEHSEYYAAASVSRCFVLGELDRVEEGFREFRRLCIPGADDFNIVFPLGVYCMRHGWKETGLSQLMRAESLRPNVPFVLAHVAAVMLDAGIDTVADERLERAQGIMQSLPIDTEIPALARGSSTLEPYSRWENPHAIQLHIVRANVLQGRGDLEGAQAELWSGNSRYAGNTELLIAMGKVLSAQGKPADATRWFSAAIFIDEHRYDGYLELSFNHAERGNLPEALELLRMAVSLRPLFPDFRYALGTLLMDLGDIDEAILELGRAVLLNPHYGHASLHLAAGHLEKSDPHEALRVLAASPCSDWPEAKALMAEAGRCLDGLGSHRAKEELSLDQA